jgi:hypothetical protein
MIELDGIQYSVATPEENVTQMVNFINNYCATHNVRNSKDEVIYIEQNTTSPIYMIMYGIAYLVSAIQRLIYSVGCAFSIGSSSERQLLNLSTLANVKRKNATKTTIQCLVYSDRTEDDPHHACVITTSLSKTITVSGTNVVFHPAYDLTIPVGSVGLVLLVAEDYGAYEIAEGIVTSFDTEVEGLRQIVSKASVPGQTIESIASLRTRLQERSSAQTQLDKAMEAIEELDGVSLCNIYFNKAPVTDAVISGITVPARKALLIVQGYNDNIAKVFNEYLTCETVDPNNNERLVLGAAQHYYTHSGQDIPVYIVAPLQVNAYVQVYIKGEVPVSLQNQVKDVVESLVLGRTIGQELSSAEVVDQIKQQLPSIPVMGAYVSLDGINYTFRVAPAADTLLLFTDTRIQVVGVV